MIHKDWKQIIGVLAIAWAMVLAGCGLRDRPLAVSVGAAWQESGQRQPPPTTQYRERPVDLPPAADRNGTISEPIIATIDGRPIARRRVVDLLIRSHGVGVLEQLVGLETASTFAAEKGLTVSQADVDREIDLALSRLSNPLSAVTANEMDREAARRLLEAVLVERNISYDEFLIVMERNAYLRKIVESQQVFPEKQLRAEFDRAYGERVRIRHIQLATRAELARVQERLAAGKAFTETARLYSANQASAQADGLLDSFSRQDERLPDIFREAAFSLEPGQVSSAVRIGEWYHLIKLEERLPPEDRDFTAVRGELERRLRDRLTEPDMFELYARLFRQANIRIHDPVLRRAFNRKHSDRGGD